VEKKGNFIICLLSSDCQNVNLNVPVLLSFDLLFETMLLVCTFLQVRLSSNLLGIIM